MCDRQNDRVKKALRIRKRKTEKNKERHWGRQAERN